MACFFTAAAPVGAKNFAAIAGDFSCKKNIFHRLQ
jgi:hypothetical protein